MTHFVTNYNNNHVTTSYNIVNWIYLTNSVQCFLTTATCFLEEIMCWKRSVDVSQDHLLVRRVLHSANTSLTTFHWRSSKLTTFKLNCIKQSTYLPLGTHVFLWARCPSCHPNESTEENKEMIQPVSTYALCPNWRDAKIEIHLNITQLNVNMCHFNYRH